MRGVRKHKCGNPWGICTACRGRLHQPDCATVTSGRLDKAKDCCPARHRMLHDQGHTHGLDDTSVLMIGERERTD